MGKYKIKFEVVDDKGRYSGEVWAWKFGDWSFSSKWTSESVPDADFNTMNAQQGLKSGQSLLMLAIPYYFSTPLARTSEFGTLEIQTFNKDDTSNTPFRTAAYHSVTVKDAIPRDFKLVPNVDKTANYTEVILLVRSDVKVTP